MRKKMFSMASLLIRNLKTLVTCDDSDTVLEAADLYAQDGVIRALGPRLPQTADKTIDGTHLICYPGLINTHHHLYQIFSRNLPQVQNLELFDWLTALYGIWKGLDEEIVRLSTLTGCAELLKHGCTTCFDHHYVFPRGCGDLLGAQFAAADAMGIRMHASRGSMDLSRKDGGLPPDSVVQTVDEILRDSVRCIEAYHDPSFGSMHQVALAPCSPFSVSSELLRQSAALARQYHVRLHTHVAETKDEERFTLEKFRMRPLEYLASLGWTGPDVWYAHGIHFNDEELRELARTGTGIAHCPISNMKLSSGVARIPEMLKAGVPVGLAVDGSASNDGSSLMEELRVCYLMHRLTSGAAAPDGYSVLKMATRGSAKLLGRDDLGQLAVGKCADLFLVDSRRLELVGGLYDPKAALATVGLRGPVDCTVVNGRIVVQDGRLVTADETEIAEAANRKCAEYLAKA
jgi:cytosine/adenosine deaminase-related metal-dependent hydrolase